ncbi:MAG: M1 family metallopeptidase [Chloroflexota bacterium]
MKIKFTLVCLLMIILCSACRAGVDPAPLPTEGRVEAEYSEPTWGEPKSYAANLTPGAQKALEQFPGASEYHIQLEIPETLTLPFTGQLEVRYTNQETVPLEEIIFRLFANYNGGAIIVTDVEVDQTPAVTSLETSDTTLAVQLPEPLEAGEAVTVSMGFSMSVPTEFGGNYGLLSYIDEILVLDLFYPMIPAYDEFGWYRQYPSSAGDLTYNDIAFYQVQVSAPENLVLVASGSEVARQTSDGRQQVSFAAGPVRDFFLAGSSQFTLLSAEVGGVTLNSYALPGNARHQQYVLDHLQSGLVVFEDLFGAYPYTEFDVVSSPMQALGIEYPGIVGIFKDLYLEDNEKYGSFTTTLLETVVIHELAHQWFYGVVGNNQQALPWVDEAVTQYSVYLYGNQVWGEENAEGLIEDWQRRMASLEDSEQPLGMAVDEYGRDYSGIIYGRGPYFFYQLGMEIGEDVLIAGLADYYQSNMWGIGTTDSIQDSLEGACECDLTVYFEEWVYP